MKLIPYLHDVIKVKGAEMAVLGWVLTRQSKPRGTLNQEGQGRQRVRQEVLLYSAFYTAFSPASSPSHLALNTAFTPASSHPSWSCPSQSATLYCASNSHL